MTASVDFGSHRIRVLTLEGDQNIVSRSFRSVYSILPDTQEQRAMLGRLGLPFAVCENHLAVLGDYADELSCVNSLPQVQLFTDGQVTAADPPARQILNTLIESMLPAATTQGAQCAVTAPGLFQSGTGSPEFLNKLVGLRGYTPVPVSAGHATVLAEGSATRFSAIGIAFGAQCCEVALVGRGNLIDRQLVAKGGDWMNIELARQSEQYVYDREGHCYLDIESVAKWKEASFRTLDRRDNAMEHTLGNLYLEMLQAVAATIQEIVRRNAIQSGPLPILCSGGVASIDGFSDAFRHALRTTNLSAEQVGSMKIVTDPLCAARGGLIQVALQSEARRAA
ncbi:MAG: hypothetical protein AB8G99_05840 [Planctomycetaceae bacterium]